VLKPGDHDLFIGEVLAVHIDEDKVSEDGRILPDRLNLLLYYAGEYWSLGSKINDFWYSKPKKKCR
jgi:flavin reductase (DIM6/NTAB) family NADH-FMN oxidoreductase RutF